MCEQQAGRRGEVVELGSGCRADQLAVNEHPRFGTLRGAPNQVHARDAVVGNDLTHLAPPIPDDQL
jgi:hypothetical protein